MKDFTEYPEYTYDRRVRDLENIIKTLEAKIEKQQKQLALYGVGCQREQLKTFDIYNCINEICKHVNHVDNRWLDVSDNKSFRYNIKKAIDKMLCKK